MKKLIYSLAMVVLALSSCTKFDDAITENYGDGPSIEVSVAAVAPTDSAFTITITPGAGTTYYAFVVDANDEAEELDAATLLRGGYGNSVVNTEKYPTLTIPVTTAEPNTTYQVYAVASNDKGIVGKIAVASIKTTDSGKPNILASAVDAAGKKAAVAFDQAISRGDGKVTAVFYKEYDFENPVQSENVDVQISGKVTQLTAVDAPAGAYVLFSWEEGAFVDATGNRCGAFTSSVNPQGETVEDIFQGLWLHVPTANWAIADSNVAPATGASIGDWTAFTGTITMAFDIFAIDEDAQDGDISVTYKNASRTITYNLPANKYAVSGKTISFVLPTEPVKGDIVSVSVKEGIAYDVYGNPNGSYSSENLVWKYVGFIPTMDMVLGNFNYYATVKGETYNLGTFSIVANAEEPNGLILKDFYLEGSEIPATASLDECKIYVKHLAYVGTEEDEGTPYDVYTYDVSGNRLPSFEIGSDGTLTSDNLILVATPDGNSLYYWVNSSATYFVPASASASAKRAASKKTKGHRGAKLNVKLDKKLSK